MAKDKNVLHFVYKINDALDLIHPYSIDDYELLSDDFRSYLDLVYTKVKKQDIVAIEITGKKLNTDDIRMIENATRNDLMLTLSENHRMFKRVLNRTIWFFVCFLFSCVLLYLANFVTSELLIQFIYLPFWFFGYRILTYPIFELYPLWNSRNRYLKMASTVFIYTEEPIEVVDNEYVLREFERREKLNKDILNSGEYINHYLMEENTVDIWAEVNSYSDIVRDSSIKGKELLTSDMEDYLYRSFPFLKKEANIKLTITGTTFNEEEKEGIERAVSNHFKLLTLDERENVQENRRYVLFFVIGSIVSALILYVGSNIFSLALHELIIMVFWFFADYLLELGFIIGRLFRIDLAKTNSFKKMKIEYDDKDNK